MESLNDNSIKSITTCNEKCQCRNTSKNSRQQLLFLVNGIMLQHKKKKKKKKCEPIYSSQFDHIVTKQV